MATVQVRYIVDDVDAAIAFYTERLRAAGVAFRNEMVRGVGVKQIIAEDPSGNPIELFEPLPDEARQDEE